ncbi:MAG: hypothetical protein ABJP34_05010 [Erythrobacter sp.]
MGDPDGHRVSFFDEAVNRAEHGESLSLEAATFYTEQTVAFEKWLLAAQLSICGAGTIAVLNMTDLHSQPRFFAALWLFVGLLFALLFGNMRVGLLSRMSTNSIKSATAFRRAREQFAEAKITGASPNISAKEEDKPQIYQPVFSDKIISRLRYVPAICIMVGAGIVGEAII